MGILADTLRRRKPNPAITYTPLPTDFTFTIDGRRLAEIVRAQELKRRRMNGEN